ncbi:MAG TPA: Ni/Fe-hydrogenase cytochrome b subunit [Dehalococcoidia bacterium]|nr:Ni/Fe-hydrogenase cytochrome b subunit [Dehalococcoidia bacterium]
MMDRKDKFPSGILILSILVIVSLVLLFIRFIYGLGAATNLSDGRPWGFWIVFDDMCGVALAAGGFTLAGIVHIFGREKYRSLYRPAILTAFLGYILVVLSLVVDLGQPWYMWHFFIYWNVDSPMFEVAVCAVLYTIVLALLFSPAVFERLEGLNFPVIKRIKWSILLKIVRRIEIPLIIAGIIISTLHQSALGSVLLLMPASLHPLWYTPVLPALFLISAIAVGPAMVIFETIISNRIFGHQLAQDVMSGLVRYIPYILGVYLCLKILDLIIAQELGLLFTAGHYSLLWWGEILIGVIIPLILLSIPTVRNIRMAVFWSSVLVVAGIIFNRFNVALFGLAMRSGYTYTPHWMEIAISVGLVADAMLVIWLAYRYLPVHTDEKTSIEA